MDQTRYIQKRIFVIVKGGVADVDLATVPEGLEVEVIDLDCLEVDPNAAKKLSRQARTYAKRKGFF